MPLSCISNKTARQCHAKAKSTQKACLNLAAYGSSVCRMHGARKPENIKRGSDHPLFKHGRRSREGQKLHNQRLRELQELEEKGRQLGLITGPKAPGRKPKSG